MRGGTFELNKLCISSC